MNGELDGLDLVQLLDLLEPAAEPAPVSMMPQTAGWVYLGLAVCAALFWSVRRLIRHRRANAYRRAGLAALDATGDDPALVASVIRRTALAAFPRTSVAGLTGDAWLEFLDATMPGKGGKGFRDGPGRVLITAPYKNTAKVAGLTDLARLWIRKHNLTEPETLGAGK